MRMLVLIALLFVSSVAHAQVSPDWYRYPALSPDGTTIVFSHAGDLYRVDSAGGRAVPLTVHAAWDGQPVWSPDGKWLAFASDRHGNLDVFLMPAEGGEATRLTWHSSNDEPSSFSPDGKFVLFASSRTDDVKNSLYPTRRFSELYQAPVTGGTPRMVLTTPALDARYDTSGNQLLYEDCPGYENAFRKHHVSSVTRDLWRVDLRSGEHTPVTDFVGEDRNPVWDGESGMYFLSERAGDMNVFHTSFGADAAPVQLTSFEHHPVRYLTRSNDGLLAFSWHGELYTLREGQEPQRLDIEIGVDRQQPALEIEKLKRGITEFAVAPDGEEIAFVARGEVFVTAADFSTTRRITDTPEQERSVSFSPDGRRLVYAGERDGSWNVYMTELADENEDWFFAATKLTETAVAATDKEEFQPRFSPDGKEVAYLLERTILAVKNLESGDVRTVMGAEYNYSYSDGDQWYDWSPDGKWFATQFLSRGRYYGDNVGLVPADGSAAPRDISNSGYGNYRSEWSAKGDAVLWVTDRYGQKNHGSWGGEMDVLAAFLTQEAWDKFQLNKEQRDVRKGRKKDDEKKDDEKDEKKKDDEEVAETAPVKIEFDGIEDRTVRLTIHSSDLGGYALTHEGEVLLYLARFEKGYDLWAHDFVDESTRLVSKLGADEVSMKVVEDGKAVFVLADGAIKKIEVSRSPDKGVSEGETSSVATAPEMNLRPDGEMQYLFDHVWRQVKEKFYDPKLHGVDWDFYRAQYEPKVAGISSYRDFAEMLSEMLGELNASHTGSGYIGGPESVPTASLGIFVDNDFDGAGLRIAEILPRGPLGDAELGIEPGMVIEAIDGVALVDPVNVNQLLAGKAGERVRLTLGTGKGKTKVEKVVTPIDGRREGGLLYDRWVEQRRALVEELSGGRVGYVHVQGMNDRSYRVAYSEILGRYFGTEAMIVDTRCNGGGWLHDDLVVLLDGKHYVDFMPRNQALDEQRFYGEPGRRWSKPSAVVVNEANYSDAHFFPWAYKELGIGPLVGMPVAGTATAVWWELLHNGEVYFGIPQVGMVDLDDGNYLENTELEPDHLVPMRAEDAAAGRDPQLKKAVEVLLETVGGR